MKKLILIFFVFALFSIQQTLPKIYIDLELEKQMRKEDASFTKECKKCEAVSQHKSICVIAEIHDKNFNQIPLGKINDESYYQEVWNIANQIIYEIAQGKNYQIALQQAYELNTDEAWDIVHNVVYQRTRELLQEKSDLTFPSLEHDDIDKKEKLKKFCVVNSNIDPVKNAPYLEATSLIMYSTKQLQKNSQQK